MMRRSREGVAKASSESGTVSPAVKLRAHSPRKENCEGG